MKNSFLDIKNTFVDVGMQIKNVGLEIKDGALSTSNILKEQLAPIADGLKNSLSSMFDNFLTNYNASNSSQQSSLDLTLIIPIVAVVGISSYMIMKQKKII